MLYKKQSFNILRGVMNPVKNKKWIITFILLLIIVVSLPAKSKKNSKEENVETS